MIIGSLHDITGRKLAEESLEGALQHLNAHMDNSPLAVIEFDPMFRIIRWSKEAERIFGWSAKEVEGKSISEIKWVYEDDEKLVQKESIGLFKGEHEHSLNVNRNYRKDGSVIYCEWYDSAIYDTQGNMVSILSLVLDITKRKQAEVALRESEEKYRTLFENMKQGVFFQSSNGKLFDVNKAALEIFGLTENQFIGKTSYDPLWEVFDITGNPIPPELHPSMVALNNGQPIRNCLIAIKNLLENKNRWLIINVTPQFLPGDGKPFQVFVSMHDITELKLAEEALKESEETYRVLVEGLPDVVMRFDRDGRHLFVSDNVSEVVNIKAYQFIGKTHRDLGFPEELCRFWEEAIQSVFDSGAPFETEYTFESKNGPAIHNWRIVPERDKQGKVLSALSISHDITAQRKAEQDYRTLFHEMLDGFALHEIICDETGSPVDYRFLAINPAFERMTGLKAENAVGRTVLETLPGTEKYWIDIYGKVALTGEPAFFENFSADLKKYFEVTAFRPAPNQFACIFSDITERKRAEENLLQSEMRLKNAQTLALVGNWEINLNTKKVWASEESFNIYGIERENEELPLDLVQKTVLPEYRDNLDIALKKLLAKEAGYDEEFQIKQHNTGNILFLHSKAELVLAQDGTPLKVIGVLQDITERKHAEEENTKLEAQLIQAQKMEAVGRLAGGVAHDFNNILTVIMANSELALVSLDTDDSLKEEINEIKEASLRAADLTRQLLAFARKQTITPKILDLNDTIAGMLKMLSRLIGEDIDLVWKPGSNLWPIKVDPSQIDQILANLSVNARDAIAGVGRLSIETENVIFDDTYCDDHPGSIPGDYVMLAVSDTGAGMDSKTIEQIFDPFFTTKEVGKGTGLGLATVYGIVKQNNGFINVYSEPGHGTTFKIYLPRVQALSDVYNVEPKLSAARGTETVFIAEDEEKILRLGKNILESYGYTVIAAQNPQEIIALAQKHEGPIHLLITDVVMPGMNGKELRDNLMTQWPDMKTLFMSGYTANIIAHHGVIDEGIQFLQKPFSVNTLALKVREALDN